MNNGTKNKIMHRLRFPEFKNSKLWEPKKLGELCDIKKGEQLNKEELTGFGSYPCLNGGINPSGYTEKYNSEGDTITISEGGNSCGYVNFMKTKFWLGGHCYKILLNGNTNRSYLYQLLKFHEPNLMRLRVGSGLPNIQQGAIRDFVLLFTDIFPEQQKIADCLSSLDELITAEIQKLEAVKAHKKGLMQQLFPSEAETLPKRRFAEFKNSDDWKEKILDEVCEINPSIEKLPNKFVYIDLESVEDGVLLQKKYINLEGAPSRAQRLLKSGDIIFQTVRPYQKNNYIFFPKDNHDYVASTGYAQLRAYESQMYLYQYLHNQVFVDKVLAKSTGTNYPAINSTDLSQILVMIPKPNEQQKIADCLSSLDEQLIAQTEKIEALKQHKKGLMQQLFPVINESK